MREFAGIQPYTEWHPEGSGLNVSLENQAANINNWETGALEYDLTGRIRVVIEGDRELVSELLGKNFLSRKARIMKRLGA